MTYTAIWKKGQGSTLHFSADLGGSPTYTKLELVTNIEGPSPTVPMTPTVDLDSVAVTKRPGLIDYGDVSVTINLDPQAATVATLLAAMADETELQFKKTFPDTSTEEWLGYVSDFAESGASTDNKNLTAEIKISVDGSVTYTPAATS